MLYYKVNKENSNKQFGTKKTKMYYVPNELFTEKECKKYNVDKALCTPVIVSKNKTHWFFGARFINYKAPYHLAIV
jgi:hypothetical protein